MEETPEYVQKIQKLFCDIAEKIVNIVLDAFCMVEAFLYEISRLYEFTLSAIVTLARESLRVYVSRWYSAQRLNKHNMPSKPIKWHWVRPEVPVRRIYYRYNIRFYSKIERRKR